MFFLWIKVLHIYFLIAWACGSFYLPRLFVYHHPISPQDLPSYTRYEIMEKRLFWIIMTPAGLITTLCGAILLFLLPIYLHSPWMWVKLSCVALLWVHHLMCYHYLQKFSHKAPPKSTIFFRFFNEIPTILYFIIITCIVIKPSL